MTPWGARESFDVLVVGKRLAMFLVAVTIYYLAAGAVIRHFDVPAVNWGSASALINTVILGLLLSFRNNVAYQRWWEARGLWGKLVNDSRNLAAKCAAFVPAEVVARARVKESVAGFAEALRRHLRDESPRLNQITGFENERADPPHVPMYLAGRLYDDVAQWKRDGVIDQATLWVLDSQLSGLLDVCGACEKIRNTPLSPSYKGLLRTGLVLNVLAEPWLSVPEAGFWAMPVFVLVCFFLFGVELIDTIVEEPFGRERDDLDLDRYCQTIRDGVNTFLDAGQKERS
ncbi:MAG TPA: bestrophin family ion channel [Lacipirellulaceae bacterium]|jgi:putative membrane protein|nr:bestrophin family ion channel [Lacipirellulaceae bacterium]